MSGRATTAPINARCEAGEEARIFCVSGVGFTWTSVGGWKDEKLRVLHGEKRSRRLGGVRRAGCPAVLLLYKKGSAPALR